MNYNTTRDHLIMPEYGRNVQKMVDYLLTIENREERNKQTRNLIEIIGNLNPQVRDQPDAKHKLWDHLYIMSDFKLDVDSPYPLPTPETLQEKPEQVPYPDNSATYRHYGNVVKKMVRHLAELEDGEYKENLKTAIANHMKKTYLLWNKDTVSDNVVLEQMNSLADGKLDLKNVNLSEKQELVRNPKKQYNNKGKRNKKRGKKKG